MKKMLIIIGLFFAFQILFATSPTSVIAADTPSITVLSPNGGESWEINSTQTVLWNSSDIPSTNSVKIVARYYTDSVPYSNNYKEYVLAEVANDGSETVSLAGLPDGIYTLQVKTSYNNLVYDDWSNSYFKIVPASSITVLSPNGGENWEIGKTYDITWKATGIDRVVVDLYKEGKLFDSLIITSADLGKSSWTVYIKTISELPGEKYKIRVSDYDNPKIYDESDNYFSIVAAGTNLPPSISGVSGPTLLRVGETGTWTVTASDPENGRLTYSVAWGDEVIIYGVAPSYQAISTFIQTATFTHSYAKAGVYNPIFTITDDKGLSAKTSISVNVEEVIISSITVLSPNGGEVWGKGKTYTIQWKSSSDVTSVYIKLRKGSDTYSGSEGMVSGTISNIGSYQWMVPTTLPDGNDYAIRIIEASGWALDDSDAAFSIVAAVECLPDDTLVKIPDDPNIYIIKNCRKVLVPSWDAFIGSGYKTSDIKSVPASDIAAIASVSLFKSPDDDKVYLIKGTKRLWIPSANAFENAGYKWSDIVSVAKAQKEAYPEANLIKATDSNKVYFLENNQKRWITTAQKFNTLGYDWNKILEVNSTELNTYSTGKEI